MVGSIAYVPRYASERIAEGWTPVVAKLENVSPTTGEWVELDKPGKYLVWLEGPADDPLWRSERLQGTSVDVLDRQLNRPLSAQRDVDLSYELNGRRGQALSQVVADRGDSYELNVSGPDLTDRRFQVGVHPRDPIAEQSQEASAWRFKKWLAFIPVVIVALLLVRDS